MNVIKSVEKRAPNGPVLIAGVVAMNLMKSPFASGSYNLKAPLFQAEIKNLYPGSGEGENPTEENFAVPIGQTR
jgi:hypothetical protein